MKIEETDGYVHLIEEGKLTWPEVPFRTRGLPTASYSAIYTAEEWWQAPHYIVAATDRESLPDVLSRVKISYSEKVAPDMESLLRLASGHDKRWRLYGVDFEDEDRIYLAATDFNAEAPEKSTVGGVFLHFQDVEEIVLQFIQIDDSKPNSAPKRKIVYRRTQGNGENAHMTLHLWDRDFGSEIVQVFGAGIVRTKIPTTLDVSVPFETL